MPALPHRHRPDRHHRLARAGERSADARPASPSSTSSAIERLGEPLVPALLRLTPSVAVATSGPAGSLTEVRIRGAESQPHLAVHRRHRDRTTRPPAIRRASRCSTPTSPRASRSCAGRNRRLWGSEAIGGVIAVNGLDDAPGYARRRRGRIVRVSPGQCVRQRSRRATPACRARSAGSARPASTASERPAATRTAIATCRAECAGPGRSRIGRAASAQRLSPHRPHPVRRLRPGHLRAYRHARQQPQPARGGAHLGRVRTARNRRGAGGSAPRCSARRTAITSPSEPAQPDAAASRRTLDAQLERRFATGPGRNTS